MTNSAFDPNVYPFIVSIITCKKTPANMTRLRRCPMKGRYAVCRRAVKPLRSQNIQPSIFIASQLAATGQALLGE